MNVEENWYLFAGVAKPVSLNEVIAAESQQKQLVQAASPKLEGIVQFAYISRSITESETFN